MSTAAHEGLSPNAFALSVAAHLAVLALLVGVSVFTDHSVSEPIEVVMIDTDQYAQMLQANQNKTVTESAPAQAQATPIEDTPPDWVLKARAANKAFEQKIQRDERLRVESPVSKEQTAYEAWQEKPATEPTRPADEPAPEPKPKPKAERQESAKSTPVEKQSEPTPAPKTPANTQSTSQAEEPVQTKGPDPALVNSYRNQIAAKVEPHWKAQSQVASTARVQIRLNSSGKVLLAKIVKSSGDPEIDAALEKAVRAASPLPVPSDPATFASEFKKFEMEFAYE